MTQLDDGTRHYSVHPRVGGEHTRQNDRWPGIIGSSPRGRGTFRGLQRRMVDGRFIPAWAGNITAVSFALAFITVHPRVGGEHLDSDVTTWQSSGSSPRGRGTFRPLLRHPVERRFIPAWAGNIKFWPSIICLSPVHPRVGGEHRSSRHRIILSPGSSPRGRGTSIRELSKIQLTRFIPAWAGNIPKRIGGSDCEPVHPRVGGEHRCFWNWTA